MKIKLDFVTNSSSSCFLMAVPKHLETDLENYVTELAKDPDSINEGVQLYKVAYTLKELDTFTNDGPLDWASKPGGPQFNNLSEESYNSSKEAIESSHIIVDVSVDYNVCKKFVDSWKGYIIREEG
jgi:hypothetical protein